jgi:hypothetical protein
MRRVILWKVVLWLSVLAGCAAPPGESDSLVDSEPEEWIAGNDVETDLDDLDTSYAALRSSAPPVRRCTTATDDPRTGHRWLYRTEPFLSTDALVRIWVEREEAGGATTHFGSIVVHAHPSEPHRWDASITNRAGSRVSLWLGARAGSAGARTATIGVAHRSMGLFARGANGFCTESRGPSCTSDEVAYCSAFAGGCGCGALQDPIEHTTASGSHAQILVVGAVGFGGTLGTAGALAASDFLLPVGDVIAIGFLAYAAYYAVVVVPRSEAGRWSATMREVASETGGVMMSVEDVIRPVPPHDRGGWPEGREAAGEAMLDALDAALDVTRRTYECRETRGGQHVAVESVWSALRGLGLTARNRGGPLRDTVDRVLQALETLVASADPGCAHLEPELARRLSDVLCRFYAILRPIPARDPGGPVALAKEGMESFFARNRYTCR